MSGAEHIPAGGGTTFIGQTDTPSAYTGQGLRRPRVNNATTALEFDYDGVDVINVEEARSDIRSTTRAGYSSFDSQPGLQTLIDSIGMHKTLYFPDNGIFNLNSKALTTKSKGQVLSGSGGNAAIINGDINIYHRFCTLKNMYLYGASTYGVNVDLNQTFIGGLTPIEDTQPTSGPQVTPRFMSDGIVTDPYYFRATDPYYANINLKNVWIAGKGIGLNIPHHLGWSRFTNLQIDKCTTYASHIDMTSQVGDWGDMVFMSCGFTHSPIGMNVIKSGGLRLVDCKMHLNTTAGLKLTSPPLGYGGDWGSLGIYITGSCFEANGPSDITTWKDIWITAQAGVPATFYPRNTQIIGGTVRHLYLDKCLETVVAGAYLNGAVTINSGATKTLIYGGPANGTTIGGTGTDYMAFGNTTAGPTITVGGRLTLIDSVNPAGKYL